MSSWRLLRAASLGLVLGAATAPLAAHAAGAAQMGGLAVRPATFDPNDPATRAYFKPVVAPGSTYSGGVVVGNSSSAPLTVYVYPVDGVTSQNSGAVYANHSDPLAKAGRWLTVGASTLTLAPDSETTVPFRVTVPADAVAGDHLAGVAVEQAVQSSSHAAGSSFTVKEVIRDVVGVSVKVPGPATFTVTAGSPQLQALPGTGYAVVKVPLTDSGTALGKPALDVTVSGPNAYHRTVHRQLDTLLPGDPISYPFVWPDDLPSGRYAVSVSVTGGSAPVQVSGHSTLKGNLTGSAAPGAGKQVIIRVTQAGSKLLLVVLALGLGVVFAGGVGVAVGRRRGVNTLGA